MSPRATDVFWHQRMRRVGARKHRSIEVETLQIKFGPTSELAHVIQAAVALNLPLGTRNQPVRFRDKHFRR